MNQKVVFLDMDGTLIDREGNIPASARKALELAAANGHEMVICSGRSATQIDPILREERDLFTGVVSSAGANVTRKGEQVWQGSLSREKTRELVRYFKENEVAYFLQSETGIFSDEESMPVIIKAFAGLGVPESQVAAIFGQTDIVAHPEEAPDIEKCCYFQCKKDAKAVQAELGDYFYVVDSSYKLTRFCDGEICRAGVTKAFGMEQYLKAAGIDHEDCIAFGDGPNDLEMIQYARMGVVMGNGTDELKALADKVCGRIDEDGIYNAFAELGLI